MLGYNSDDLFEKSFEKPYNSNQITMEQTYETYGSKGTHKYFIFRRQYIIDSSDDSNYTIIENEETFLIPKTYAEIEKYIKKPFMQDWRIYRQTVPVQQPRNYEEVVKQLYGIDLKASLQEQHNGYDLWVAVQHLRNTDKQ